jgi:transposase
MLYRSYRYVLVFAVLLVLAPSKYTEAAQESTAIDVAADAKNLRSHLEELAKASPEQSAILLPKCEALLRRIDRVLDGYFHHKNRVIPTGQRRRIRSQLLRLHTGKYPILVFTNDAMRFHSHIHNQLSEAYGRCGKKVLADGHRMQAVLSAEQ